MNKRIWTAAALSAAATATLPQMMNLKGNLTAMSNSWISVIVWVGFFAIFYLGWDHFIKINKYTAAVAGIYGFFLAVSLAFGAQLEHLERVEFTDGLLWVSIAVWTVIFAIGACLFWRIFQRMAGFMGKNHETPWTLPVFAWWERQSGFRQAGMLFGFFLFSWLPVFLAVYPGFFVYDAQDELLQAMTRNFTTHHPLPHVMLLGGVILLVNKISGSYNLGIAVYTVLQMIMMAGVFTAVIKYLKKSGLRFGIRAGAVLYFAFFPVIVMFTLCSAKDGIFSAALLMLTVSLTEIARDKKEFFSSLRKPAVFMICAFVMISFRHNGFYALLVFTPFFIGGAKGYRRKAGIMVAAVLALYFLTGTILVSATGAREAGNQEMLTVPIQQLARTYVFNGESFLPEDKELLFSVLPEEALDNYVPKVSDGVKYWFDNESFSSKPGEYFDLWLRVGLKHPFTYMNAWLMTSYGFWYPDTIIDVYRGNSVFTFTYEDSSFFGYEVEEPGIRQSKIPFLDEWYRKLSLEVTQQKIPVISMLFSPGFLFWIYALLGCGIFVKLRGKEKLFLLPFLLLFIVWLTVIIGPTYLPRYVLFLWFGLPILVNTGYLCYTTHDLKKSS